MSNNLCQVITPKVSSRFIGKVNVPSGGLVAGNIIIADTLTNTISGNYEVFNATKPLTDNLGSNFFALVVNDGFETLPDGRRVAGDPNYYNYSYKEGEVAPIVFLEKHLMFQIGLDSIDQTTLSLATVGNFLIPTNNSLVLSAVNSIPSAVSTALKILAIKSTPVGGKFGGQFITTLICTPVVDDIIDTGAYIYTFSLPNQVGTSIINQTNGTITAVVAGSRSSMAASFSTSRDAVVKVGSTTQVSGTTTNNFTSAVTYTVTSESGESKTYVVTVSLETYDLDITKDENTTVTVTKGGNPVTEGSNVLTYGDSITITATPATGYEIATLTVNGETFTSGESLTVTSNVSIIAESSLIDYTLTLTKGENTELSVVRGETTLETGATIHYGDVLTITAEATGTLTLGLTVNGNAFTSGETYSVIGDTTVVSSAS